MDSSLWDLVCYDCDDAPHGVFSCKCGWCHRHCECPCGNPECSACNAMIACGCMLKHLDHRYCGPG